jgi:hypothetical protein
LTSIEPVLWEKKWLFVLMVALASFGW